MILEIIQQILGITLFFSQGFLLSYIIFPKIDIIKRVLYSVLLSPLITVIMGVLLYLLNLFTQINFIITLVFLDILFVSILILRQKNKEYITEYNKDVWYILFFSLIGTLWRLLFLNPIRNFGDAYIYSGDFIGKTIPNLGFYTGMAVDHSRFIGNNIFTQLASFLLINKIIDFFGTFLITFLFLGFIYLIFSEFRNKKWAFAGVALMSFGPVEIFHTTINFFGHSFSYLGLFSLFLLYKSENKNYFLLPLLLSIVMVFTYFTSCMINAFLSIGFVIALFLKFLIKNKGIKKNVKNLQKKKIVIFVLIALISLSFVFSSFYPNKFSFNEESSNVELITKHIVSYPIMEYKDSTFLGLSAIRWQMLFFFLCGLTFVFYIIRKIKNKQVFLEDNLDLLLCLVPILIVSSMFYYTNFLTRIFNYFAFFGLLVLRIPKKYFKIFLITAFIFMLITGFCVAKAKRPFFETSDKEIEAVLWVKNNLEGKIFSDQSFISPLVQKGYYNVTGANDGDPLVYNLFYQNDFSLFLNAINELSANSSVDYIVLTKRMHSQYILMLDIPQKPLINQKFYEENLIKVYDNGGVKIYKIELK